MTAINESRLKKEADFIEKYTAYYRRQMMQAMRSMNDASPSLGYVRLCMEAIDLMRASNQTLVEALAHTNIATN